MIELPYNRYVHLRDLAFNILLFSYAIGDKSRKFSKTQVMVMTEGILDYLLDHPKETFFPILPRAKEIREVSHEVRARGFQHVDIFPLLYRDFQNPTKMKQYIKVTPIDKELLFPSP